MKVYSVILFTVFILIHFNLPAQKITISGHVSDAASKEALIGASVIHAGTKSGTITNQYGFFSLTVPVADTIEILISYTGYDIQAKKIIAKSNLRMDILLEPATSSLGDVIVTTGK